MTGPTYRTTDLLDLTGISRAQLNRWRTQRLIPPPLGYGRWAVWLSHHVVRVREIVAAKDANVTHRDLYDRFHPPLDEA